MFRSTHTVHICLQPGKFETLPDDFEPMLEPYIPLHVCKTKWFLYVHVQMWVYHAVVCSITNLR
jgi:hypothetical protein